MNARDDLDVTAGSRLLWVLANLMDRDGAGRHFTCSLNWELQEVLDLESLGLVQIHRPVHEPTGIPYSLEYWSAEPSEEGFDLLDRFYDERDYSAE